MLGKPQKKKPKKKKKRKERERVIMHRMMLDDTVHAY